MPNTRITRQRWSTHLHYGKFFYLLIAVVMWMAADMAYSVTEYRPPNARKVEIELVSPYVDLDRLAEIEPLLLEAGQAYERAQAIARGEIGEDDEYEAPLQEVTFTTISYSGDATEDYYGAQKYMVTLAAQEGDIYIVTEDELEELVTTGVALSLDPYIESGLLDPGERDLARVTYHEAEDNPDYDPQATHVYALQADPLYGLYADEFLMDVRGMYIVVTCFSENPDTAAATLAKFMEIYQTERPARLDEAAAPKGEVQIEEMETGNVPANG